MTAVIVSVPHSGTHWLKQKLGSTKALHCDPGGGWRKALNYGEIHVPLRDPLLSCISRKARHGIDDNRVALACLALFLEVKPHVTAWHPLEGVPVNVTPANRATEEDVPIARECLESFRTWMVPFYQNHGVELSWA